ncbi:Skp family chaperone [Elusimicrobium simillimum]|uniref:hypothetical protein n=1 Tax=Elusimicrobium simillimum TaxID=3143438 RepID=UPI003C6EB106
MKKNILLLIFLLAAAVGVRGQALSAQAPQDAPGAPVAAYLDITYVFKNHPWTSNTKASLQSELQSKALEIEELKKDVEFLREETALLDEGLQKLKPFYKANYFGEDVKIYPVPKDFLTQDKVDSIVRDIVFSGADIRFNSPVDSYLVTEKYNDRIKNNIAVIYDKELAIEQQKYDTKNKVKQEEGLEVQEILADIYEELKLYAQKRNIAIIVNKKDILYGQKPVDITADFMDRIKKTKKNRKGKKDKEAAIVVGLDKDTAPEIKY